MRPFPKRGAAPPKLLVDPDACKAIGCYVRSARSALSVSQNTFSELLGVNRTTLLRLERGACPLKTALCVSALHVLERLGVRSELIEHVVFDQGQRVQFIDLLIDFGCMKRLHEVAGSPNPKGRRLVDVLGKAYVPPLANSPLRKK